MTDMLLSQPVFMLLSLILAVVVSGAMISGTLLFEQQRSRLDPATRWNDIRERLAIKSEELARTEAEITEANRKLSERDRIVAETVAIEERRDAIRLELAALEDARRQIEETKQAAADVATELAVRQTQLETTQKEIEAADRGLADRKAELARVIDEIEKQNQNVKRLPGDLKRTIAELEAAVGEIKVEKSALEAELQALRSERGLLIAERAEHADLVARKASLEQQIGGLVAETKNKSGEVSVVTAELAKKAAEFSQVQHKVLSATQELQSARDVMQALVARREILEREIENSDSRGDRAVGVTEDMISDLKKLPTVLTSASPVKRVPQEENEALQEVNKYLKDLKLSYDSRIVTAFHTALKINDTSQLTVLAGVSGTGKSLLPRRYAEGMGIKFLPIAVEPRWDSPQDLLGFYNYIEKRYRATDLARSLVHMDPNNTSTLSDAKFGDQLMLILLDEMNLARVEYYFSEFLSRLESRASYTATTGASSRQDSLISIDIRGTEKSYIHLFPPHNMLFVGTMNDDESTQSLSDKVLDRSNIMQFAAPREFSKQQQVIEVAPRQEYRSFKQWRNWVKPIDKLQGAANEKAHDIIRQLADIMERCGRPFGHRLNASILAYAANYPRRSRLEEGLEMAMADQIEFRILPKLRGLRIDDNGAVFERIGRLMSGDLNDSMFSERLQSIVEAQREAGGLFNWRGYTRNTDGTHA